MKKLIFTILSLFFSMNFVFAASFDEIEGLTPVQKQKLSNINFEFEQKNNSLNLRLNEYSDKIEMVKNDTDKTEAQKSLLVGAYERNIETLKSQQKLLKQEVDNLYKSVLTEEQYIKYGELR